MTTTPPDTDGSRPGRLLLVVGTATEVGKTWVGCELARELRRRGRTVAARKPAQSFESGDDDRGVTDAQLLGQATGEDGDAVTPPHRWYPVPMAPPMAADVLGRPPVRLADLVAETTWTPGTDVGILETAGAVRSPLAEDGDAVVLAARTGPDLVLLVADAGLGTIGAVRAALAGLGLHPTVVLLNRYDDGDDLHRRNASWLRDRDGLDVVTTVAELADRL